MRKIEPYFDDPPPELWEEASKKRNRTKGINPTGASRIEQALSQKSEHDFDSDVYGGTAVKEKLKIIFKGKCAFCETNTHVGAHKDVEHFRFKKHYYWLGYEWTNLLLSCQICNRNYKRMNFPLAKGCVQIIAHPLDPKGEFDRASCHILSETLKAEQALLLHPAIDDPKEHLKFSPDGTIEGISEKGKKSVEFYGLYRDLLEKARHKIVFDIKKDICEEYLHNVPDDNRIRLEIRKVITKLMDRIENKDSEYVGFAISILENFEAFIIDNPSEIDLPDKEIIRQAAKEILAAPV